jgi:hypothetical protein
LLTLGTKAAEKSHEGQLQLLMGAMMRRAILFVSAIASTLLSSSVFAAGAFGTIHVGNWQGGAFTNDTTGAFSHCWFRFR